MYGIELSRRAVRRRVQEAAEAVTEPFAWHHGDFVKTTPPFSLSFSVSRFRGVYSWSPATRFTGRNLNTRCSITSGSRYPVAGYFVEC